MHTMDKRLQLGSRNRDEGGIGPERIKDRMRKAMFWAAGHQALRRAILSGDADLAGVLADFFKPEIVALQQRQKANSGNREELVDLLHRAELEGEQQTGSPDAGRLHG